MSIRVRTVILCTAVLATAGALPAPPAHADTAGEPIIADLTGDGLSDRAYLGATAADYCSVVLQPGHPPGVFVPPSAYVYLRPVPGGGPESCPDIGTAFDWDADSAQELWIGWSRGAPAGLGYNRLILDHYGTGFRPVGTFTSPITPVRIDTAVFTPGAVPTPYSVGLGGFASYAIDGPTTGLHPQRWCSADTPALQLRDVDHNGAVDALLAYTDGCADHANGVVLVFDDGRTRQLEHGPDIWSARFAYGNADRAIDIRTENRVSGQVHQFIGRDGGTFVLAPVAVAETVTVPAGRASTIDVLANDVAGGAVRVVVTTPPRYGTATVNGDGRIVYRPAAEHGSTDRLGYRLGEEGRSSGATVTIRISG
ncbi:Ig-like domain-containing protein [Plantactinospora sp. KBS50]|uniref:Ig-like domain-containing protein n=1 Tax=Plantactinospora sp. KBS50 TaxID=2024580 RepID=UPI000BAB0814|nr:Ig-like domain-containing protein [Plantactinospora sp. KBS50]ASW56434.1 hypothetical protein CIK06_23145 [Plantactinospora sp. KBS50]